MDFGKIRNAIIFGEYLLSQSSLLDCIAQRRSRRDRSECDRRLVDRGRRLRRKPISQDGRAVRHREQRVAADRTGELQPCWGVCGGDPQQRGHPRNGTYRGRCGFILHGPGTGECFSINHKHYSLVQFPHGC